MSTTEARKAALENGRQPDGRFGPWSLDEAHADVDLSIPAPRRPDDSDAVDLELAFEDWESSRQIGTPISAAVAEWRNGLVARQVIESKPTPEPERIRFREFLDTALRWTAPTGHFSWKKAVRNAVTKGGIALAAVLCLFAPIALKPSAAAQPRPAPDQWSQSYDFYVDSADAHDCYLNGLPEGEVPKNVIMRAKVGGEIRYRVVNFTKGWEMHHEPMSGWKIISVCRH